MRHHWIIILLLPLLAVGQIPEPPGKLIDVGGGVQLHIHCTGNGSPTVVLEAGFPGSSLDWVLVQPSVSQFTRTCSYDRAGFAWSQLGKLPRSSVQIADDLQALLAAAGVQTPYLFVGHSMGGLYVRAYARKYPGDIAGMVLVDATHEDQWHYEPKRYWQGSDVPIRVKAPEVVRPGPISTILTAMWATDRWKTGERAERDAIKITVADAQKEPKRLPVIPLIVLSAGEEAGWLENAPIGALKSQQLQRELAALTPLGKWRAVPGANHYIHLSQPAAVVESIREVVQAVRDAKPVPLVNSR